MSRLVDKIFEKLTMNLENSDYELTEKRGTPTGYDDGYTQLLRFQMM